MSARMPPQPRHEANPGVVSPARAALARGIGFVALWVVLMPSAKPADLLVGLLVGIAATWLSLRLLPPQSGHLRFTVLLMLVPHFLWQSVLAGFDVARRAFHPRMPMSPGFVDCPLGLPRGLTRNTFATITSLLPGSVPCADNESGLTYHCLDIGLPNVEQLQHEEALFARALIPGDEEPPQ